MKKLVALVLALIMMGVMAIASAEVVDAYTSASLTKSFVTGADLDALAVVLSESGADIATKSQTEAEGYQKGLSS